MSKPSLLPAIQELEQAYDALSRLLCKPQIARPVIVIQSRGRGHDTLGWHRSRTWGERGKPTHAEITLCAETLDRPTSAIIETLVHEMAHAANAAAGIHDCTVNQYHNRAFRDRAESMGLMVERDERRGWARTTAGPVLAQQIADLNMDETAFRICRDALAAGATSKQTTRMRKWTCGCTLIRAAVDVVATCGKCGRPFRRV